MLFGAVANYPPPKHFLEKVVWYDEMVHRPNNRHRKPRSRVLTS